MALITVWLVTTQVMRHIAIPRLKAGQRWPMLATSGVSLACWVYGAFLGVAKGLAYGAAPFAVLLSGFALTLAVCVALTFTLADRARTFSRA